MIGVSPLPFNLPSFFLSAVSLSFQDLDKLGLKVLEVQARVAEPPTVDPSSGLLFYIGGVACFAILALVTMKIVTANKERTRKRRMIRATTWFPPTDQQCKSIISGYHMARLKVEAGRERLKSKVSYPLGRFPMALRQRV